MADVPSGEKTMDRRRFLKIASAGAATLAASALGLELRPRSGSDLPDLIKLLSESESSQLAFYIQKAKGIVNQISSSESIEPLSSVSLGFQYETDKGPNAKVNAYASRNGEDTRLVLTRDMNDKVQDVSKDEFNAALDESLGYPESGMVIEGKESATFTVPNSLLDSIVAKINETALNQIHLVGSSAQCSRQYGLSYRFTQNPLTYDQSYMVGYRCPVMSEGVQKVMIIKNSQSYKVAHHERVPDTSGYFIQIEEPYDDDSGVGIMLTSYDVPSELLSQVYTQIQNLE